MWGEEPVTTIEFKNWTKAPSSAYSSTAFTDLGCTFTFSNNNYSKTSSWNYIRLGGKGGSDASSTNTQTSTIKYNTASTSPINKVVLSHNGISNANVTINSVTLDVYSNNSFTTKIATVTKTTSDLNISTSTSGTIEFTTNTSWAVGSYFMISVNWTIKGKSNYGFDATKIEFYEASADPTPTTYNVNIANNIANGTVTANPTSAAEGATVTLTATPASGYELGSWNVTNASTSAEITVTNNKFTMPAANVSVSATFNAIATHEAKFFVNGQQYGETLSVAEGSAITFPTNKPTDIEDKKFVGWFTSEYSHATNAPAFVTSATMGTQDVNYYAVFATAEGGKEVETMSQTLQYDTWTYSGSTTDKSSYRLFHSGSYIESESFDRSKLSKVVVYGGTFGGDSYNKLTIGDGTNTWKSVTVSGSSQTGKNTYTGGTTLSGTGSIRITSNSGSASSNGVRISKVEIYTMEGGYTYSYYCTTISTKTLKTITVKNAPTKVTYTEDEMFDPAGLIITATYDDESTEDVAYATNASAFTFSPSLTTALTPADESVTITYKEKTCSQTITVNAIPTYTLTITQPQEGGTLTVKNGETLLENGANIRVGTNLTCEVTGIPEGKRFSRFYAKWGGEDGQSKYKATNPATFDNIATESITTCEIYVTYKDIQYYTINYMINGINTNPQENVEEKTALTFPTAPATLGGKYFVGWVNNEIKEPVDEEPSLVNTSEQTATANKTYYAVYAAQGEGGAATYTKATSLAVGDKVVFGLGEADGKPAQAVTGANSGATISATESEWIVYTATTYTGKDGIVLQIEDGNYQRAARGSFDFTPDNPATFVTNASSHIIGYSFTLYNTPSNGNKFYSSKGEDYVEFLMWKVEGGASYSNYTTFVGYTRPVTSGNFGTICLPCATSSVEGATFYNIAGVKKAEDEITGIVLEEVEGNLEAGNPYIFKATATTLTATYTGKAVSDAVETTGLVGNLTDNKVTVEATGYNYVIGDNKIHKVVTGGTGVTIGANRAYLNLENVDDYTPAGSNRAIFFGLDGTVNDEWGTLTGVDSVETTTNNTIYNLQGQRLNRLQQGVNIVNGRKVIR